MIKMMLMIITTLMIMIMMALAMMMMKIIMMMMMTIMLIMIMIIVRFVSLRPHVFTLSPTDMKLLNHEHRVSFLYSITIGIIIIIIIMLTF